MFKLAPGTKSEGPFVTKILFPVHQDSCDVELRDGPLEKMIGGGWGWGIFSLYEIFFFAHCLCRIFFSR